MIEDSVFREKYSRKRLSRQSVLSQFSVAIVEPEFGINLGYLARTTANFGMKRLLVVSRKELSEENLSKATLFAAHGRDLIEKLEYASSVTVLRRKYKILIGTTAIEGKRKSNITRKTLAPDECAEAVLSRTGKRVSAGNEICFLFGRDTTGLTNEELKSCDYHLTIRTQSSYNTLNVSHAAAIIFYVFSSIGKIDLNSSVMDKGTPYTNAPSRIEKERVISLFLRLAEDAEFKRFKLDLLRESLERVLNRGAPSLRELHLLMGLASKADSKIKRLSDHTS